MRRNGDFMSEKILLTITMLVSDREDTIEKCMKSLVHLREAVPSELIVVDTAENKVCMDIVRQYTDNIVRFEWCSDFAAARNAGVKKAKGDWIMILDDDEWFETTENLEQFFLSSEYKKYHSATYIQRNYLLENGSRWEDFNALRLVQREAKTAFYGKIHEQFVPLHRPIKYLQDYVHHYGYVYKSVQERNAHLWRNIKPLLDLREKNPRNYHVAAQLLQEYVGANEKFSAIELSKEIRNTPGCWEPKNARFLTYVVLTEMLTYVEQQRYGDGYEAGKEILSQKGISILAKGSVCNQMVACCYLLEKYEEALYYIDLFEQCLKEWEAYPDKNELVSFSVTSKYLIPEEAGRFALLKLEIYARQENWSCGAELLQTIDWNNAALRLMNSTPKYMVLILKNVPYDAAYFPALKRIQSHSQLAKSLYEEIDHLTGEEWKQLLCYMRLLPDSDDKLCIYHLIYAKETGEQEYADAALNNMKERNSSFFVADERFWQSLQILSVDINSYMRDMAIYEWINRADGLMRSVPLKTCELIFNCLSRGLKKENLRFLYLNGLILEMRLLKPAEEDLASAQSFGSNLSAEKVWEALLLLSQYWIACAASLYREEVFLSDLIQAIPPAYQFAWYIMQAKSVKDQDAGLFRRKVADAAKAYPVMKELCKKVITEQI